MNRLSTKDNKGYCICVAVFSIMCALMYIFYTFFDFNIFSTNIIYTLYGLYLFLEDAFASAAFLTLSILMIIQAIKCYTYKTYKKLFLTFVVLYSIFTFLSFVSLVCSLALGNMIISFNVLRAVFCTTMIICLCRNQLNSVILKITSGIFTLLSFSLKAATISNIFFGLLGILEPLPIFLYFLFYNRINTPCDIKIKRNSIEAQLIDLKEKLDSGLITLDEYNTVKQNIPSKINIG